MMLIKEKKRKTDYDTPIQRLKLLKLASSSEEQSAVSCGNKSSVDLVTAKLQKCIELNDKVNKENAWRSEVIELLFTLSANPLNANYCFFGQGLSAATKVYALRLDSLYGDVTRMTNFLGQDSSRKNVSREAETSQQDQRTRTPAKIMRKARRKGTTVTKTPESLNAKLLTRAMTDPFFAKVSTFVEDTEKSNRMFTNMLPSRNSSFRSTLNDNFWDTADQDLNIEALSREQVSIDNVTLQDAVVRTSLADFLISDEPLEEFRSITYIDLCDEDDDMHEDDFFSAGGHLSNFGESGYLSAFSLSAFSLTTPIEDAPTQVSDDIHIDEEISDVETAERLELQYIEDMEPDHMLHYEYAFRSEETIKHFCYGPAYWKYLKKRTTRRQRSKARKVNVEVTLNDIRNFDATGILPVNEFNSTKKLAHRESSNDFRLPEDFRITSQIFSNFKHCSLGFSDPIVCHIPELEPDDLDEGLFDDDFNHDIEMTQETEQHLRPLHDQFKFQARSLTMKRQTFNINRIKNMSLTVIANETQQAQSVKFSVVHSKVGKLLSDTKETPSCAMSFLSVLVAASEQRIELQQEFPLKDFNIKFRQC